MTHPPVPHSALAICSAICCMPLTEGCPFILSMALSSMHLTP